MVGDKVFLTQETYLYLHETNLRGGKYLNFKPTKGIYYEVRILKYDSVTQSLFLEVTDYNSVKIKSFEGQIPKSSVSYIHFMPLSWQAIERRLSSYIKGFLVRENIVVDDGTPLEISNTRRGLNWFGKPHSAEVKPSAAISDERLHIENAKVYFKQAEFNPGYVEFRYKSEELKGVFNIKVHNPFLLKEFNSIKSYFPKALGVGKQFSVSIVFRLVNNIVSGTEATSIEISKINQDVIDAVKHERITNLTSVPIERVSGKTLYTEDDIFNRFEAGSVDGNVFGQTGEDILHYLIKARNPRNAKQLEYLSGCKQSTKQKLRFSLNPLFGFLFFIEGQTKNHFCWELLDTHATYIWTLEKLATDINVQYERIERTLNLIGVIKRNAYKADYKNKRIDTDISFESIEHGSVNTSTKDKFSEWRSKLENVLI